MSPATATQQNPEALGEKKRPVVAMVGAGQLARMTHQAAIALDVELRVMAGDSADSAVAVGAPRIYGSPAELADLRKLADGADVVTFDHEGIAPEHLAALTAGGIELAPSAVAKLFAQDKLHARRELGGADLPVPPFIGALAAGEIVDFAARFGWPLVAKAPRGGYDGRGVYILSGEDNIAEALTANPNGLLIEPHLEIERELAVLLARSRTGETVVYPVVETVQREAMCREILAPALIATELAEEAQGIAAAMADEIGATGIMAVELFEVDGALLINELALRPHNSGHYTIEGCETSQFEQHLRAVLGWPLGLPTLRAPAVATVNVVGGSDGSDPATRIPSALEIPGVHIHLYGKAPRPHRKLGHVTVCGDDPAATRDAARRAAALLEGPGA